MNEWIPHPDSSSLLIYDECNSCPHMCSCYRPYSSHFYSPERHIWGRPVTLPLNGGKGRGGPVPLSTSINLQPRTRPLSSTFPDSLLLDSPKKKMGGRWRAPAIQKWNWGRSNVGCVGRREEEGEEQEVSGSGGESRRDRVDEWRREERDIFQIEQCELELGNKRGEISQAANTCTFLHKSQGCQRPGTHNWLRMFIKLWYFFFFFYIYMQKSWSFIL